MGYGTTALGLYMRSPLTWHRLSFWQLPVISDPIPRPLASPLSLSPTVACISVGGRRESSDRSPPYTSEKSVPLCLSLWNTAVRNWFVLGEPGSYYRMP
ncbi:hypothetical protein FKM82_022417 [Ascaphus truei]